MRIYLSATLDELNGSQLQARTVRAVSPAWLAQFEDDLELAELLAHRLAAMDSVGLSETEPWVRLVVSADVPDTHVAFVDETQAQLAQAVTWQQVAAFHVDDAAASELVELASSGDEDAAEKLWDSDLLWFDASERDELIASFS